jgi:hypothetical protein
MKNFVKTNFDRIFWTACFHCLLNFSLVLAAAPGISSRVGSAHPNPFLAPILNLVSHALENFQGG